MANAVQVWDHKVIVTTSADTVTPPTTVELTGVQADVQVDPQELQQFGFKVKRVFSLTVFDPAKFNQISNGMRAVEQNTGETARVLHSRRDFLGVTFFFGTVNQ